MRGFLIAAILGGMLICSGASAQNGRQIIGQPVVIDGDTIQVRNERIRLWGIDAFEPSQKCGEVECGKQATDYLKNILSYANASGFEQVICTEKDKDRYGRIVALCRIGSTDLSAAMVLAGHAVAFRKYSRDYVTEEDFAKLAKMGAWAGTFQKPEDFRAGVAPGRTLNETQTQSNISRNSSVAPVALSTIRPSSTLSAQGCNIKGNINSKGEKIYHLPNSPNYSRTIAEEMFCSENAALYAGYRAPLTTQTRRAVAARPVTRSAAKRVKSSQRRNVWYANCSAARAATRTPIYYGEPGYARHLDRDGDGAACE